MADGELILATGALLAGALAASLLAGRLRVPGLLLFLALGMLIGSEGTGWIDFGSEMDDYEVARTIGIAGLALILFEGGLTAGYQEIRPVLGTAISLATVGTILTALIGGLTAAWLFDLSTLEGLLLGAILAATDSAAIFAVLRGSTLRRKLARTLEGEAGLNDPVAVLLVIGFIDWIEDPDYGAADMALSLTSELLIGAAVGLGIGWVAVYGLRRTRLASAGLYPVASIAIAALAFGLADVAHGSGFLAVYLAGLALGSAEQIPAKRTITTFHVGLAWLAQVAMFLTLGLLVFPSELAEVALQGTALGLVIAIVARPVATFIATAPWRYSARERVVLGWAGLRGALPVVFATFPVIEEIPDSLDFFNIVFFAVIVSTLLQGATFEPLARWLGVTDTEAALPLPLADSGAMRRLGAEVIEYPVGTEHAIVGSRVRELGLPRDALLNLLIRGDQALLPRGSTRIEAGDRLHLIARQEVAIELRELMGRWREGPIGSRPRPVRKHPSRQTPFVLRPWAAHPGDDGDPSHPSCVHGIDVIEQIRTRRDGRPGAVVLLEDGRYAFTGNVVAMGTPSQVQMAARRRLRLSKTDSERAWWREVIGALAAPEG
jgi:cell volume regulation protein A